MAEATMGLKRLLVEAICPFQSNGQNVLCLKKIWFSMFYRRADDGYASALDGIYQKTLVYGDETLLTEFKLEKGKRLPNHSHPHEQTGYLVSGKIRLSIEDEEFDALPGDSWNIPSNVEHGALILEDSVAVEVFSPVRTDYLPQCGK